MYLFHFYFSGIMLTLLVGIVGSNKTFAEMTDEEKDDFSMRKKVSICRILAYSSTVTVF